MASSVFLNGRFLHQPVTGVQRFSAEITAAIDRLIVREEWPETVVLAPGSTGPDAANWARSYRKLPVRAVGRRHGHVWEQTDLPRAARGGVLVSLGNTAPVMAGRRQVVVIHDTGVFDTPESYSFRFRSWYKALQRGLVRTGAKVVTVSNFSRQHISTHLRLDPAQITVMYEGADHILRVPPDLATLERYNLHPQKFALVVGNRAAHKNLRGLQEVAAALQRRGMVIAVAGGANADLFRGDRGRGVAERRLGRVSDAELRMLYENAAFLLFPSYYEGFGLPPVEAMACNCPVLVACGGAVEEICGDSALYFASRDGRTMTEAVERLLDQNGLAATLRARGQKRVAALSWDASARVLGDVVRRMQSAVGSTRSSQG